MAPKTSPEVEHKILTFLELNWSHSVIIKYFKNQNIVVNSGTISKIKKRKENSHKIVRKVQTNRKSVLSERQLSQLKVMVNNPSPLPQQAMANKLNTSRQVIAYKIKHKLNKKLVKKPRCHALSASTVKKRWLRSWSLYLRLRGQRWQKVITSDEALFHITDANGKTKVQYKTRGQKKTELEVHPKVQFPKGVMVWIGISANGCTTVRFVKPGVKINSDYYIRKILKPFIRRDIPKLYPNGDYVFHQDSAPSHASKKTIKFLKDNKISFIPPTKWMPNSPDAAPLDYFFWGYLKKRLNRRKVRTIRGLQKAIREEVAKVPQNMINKALKSWGRRCRHIYYNKGLHIENYK
jgi:hypothetical protein